MQENKEHRMQNTERRAGIREFFSVLGGEKVDANERLVGYIGGVAFCLAAMFFGKCGLFFGTFPLGIALLCAADRHLPFILAGLYISAPSTGIPVPVCIVTYTALAAVRVFISRAAGSGGKAAAGSEADTAGRLRRDSEAKTLALKVRRVYFSLFAEKTYLRMASSCIGAFCLSIYPLIYGGFRYYDLFGLFFSLVAAPGATFLFSLYFGESGKNTRLRDLGILSLLAAVCFSVRNVTLFGVYVGAFVAFFATLCIGRRKGILFGCIGGLALGLAFEPTYAPLFLLEAAAAGVLWNISSLAAATAGCIVGMIWGVYVNGMTALSQLLPALLCGAMVFGAADRLSLITGKPELIKAKQDDRAALEVKLCEMINDSDEACVQRLSSTFAELAETFYNLSDRRRRPEILDLRRMCDGVFLKYCSVCPKSEVCRGVEYGSTLEIIDRLAADLHMKARVEAGAVPEYLRSRCAAMPQMITEINESCAKLTEHALMCDRTGVFALDYDGMSRILSEALDSGRADYIIDESSAEEVSAMLKKLRFGCDGVIVYGGRRKSVAIKGLDASRAKISVRELREKLGETLGVPMGEPVLTPSDGKTDMTVSAARRFSVEEKSLSLNAVENGSERFCGDTAVSFEGQGDRCYSLISDGMGSGKEAAFTSRICSMFLEKMLAAGNRSETSLRLLNSFMSERDGSARHECSATVDLFEYDLLTGAMYVTKSGAAPTYIKRGNNCFRLRAKTVPVGIIDRPDCERIGFDAEVGDVVIMMSDGVTQNRDECVWLLGMLNTEWEDDLGAMAQKIVTRARAEGSEDDITVTLIRICEND